ncbi:MAG: VCBS repeat-containing protein [Phycisphaeraceae bacterium]|nr:VCBS repeat-containing protein [Phycisphaeraceae bacterium]
MRTFKLLCVVLVVAAAQSGWGQIVIFDENGLADGYQIVRGELVDAPDGSGVKVLRREHQPETGDWDTLRVQTDKPQPLRGRRWVLSASINMLPRQDQPTRLRRIDLMMDDKAGSIAFEADAAHYRIDGQEVPPRLWINFDSDPRTWQQLQLDISSGPGVNLNAALERISFLFTNPLDLYVRDIRLVELSSPGQGITIETRDQPGGYEWISDCPYRIMVACPALPQGVKRLLAWASMDVEDWLNRGLIAAPGCDPVSVRVVEYDPATQKPVTQRSGTGEAAVLVPCKMERWPRLPMPYSRSEMRRPLQVSWLRRADGPARPIYAIYFDLIGKENRPPIDSPAMIGGGDALAFGQPVQPVPARGTPIPIDYNGDGLMDLITLLGMVPERGAFLMINHGSPERELLSQPVYIGQKSVGGTPQVADIDGDGKLDLGCRGGFYRDLLGKGFDDYVAISNVQPAFDISRTMPESRSGENWSFADWDGDGVTDVMIGGNYWWEYGWTMSFDHEGNWTRGPLRGWFYFFRNIGDNQNFVLDFPKRLTTTDGKVADVYGYASPVTVDIDRDGDLDLISGDFLDGLWLYENVGSRTEPQLAPPLRVKTTEGDFHAQREVVTPVVCDWDGDGDDDILIRCEGSLTTLLENTSNGAGGMPTFLPERRLDCRDDRLAVGELPVVDMHDWDSDGDQDLIYGNSSGDFGWYENTGSDSQITFANDKLFTVDGKPYRVMAGPNGSIQGPAEALWGYTVPDVADWDGDGLPDIMYNSIWGLIEWLRNPGPMGTSELAAPQPLLVEWPGPAPKPAWRWWDPKPGQWSTQWRCNVRMIDWDGDQLLDAVSLDTEGYLVLHKRYREGGQLKLAPPQRFFLDKDGESFRANPVRPGNSGRIKFDFADWDGDGDRDYMQVVPASWHRGNAVWYENTGSDEAPVLEEREDLADVVLTGHTCSPRWIDLDGDSELDVLIAAEDGHFYFFSRPYIEHKDQLEAQPLLGASR